MSGVSSLPVAVHLGGRVHLVCELDDVIALLKALTKEHSMSAEVDALVAQFESFLARMFEIHNALKRLSAANAPDIKKVRDLTARLGTLLGGLNVPGVETPSILTADVGIGVTTLSVDSVAGWVAGEAVEFEGGVLEECVLESIPGPNTLVLKAPGVTSAHMAGETVS